MKEARSLLAGERALSLRMERNLGLIFALLGGLLVGATALHWLLVLEPALRGEASSRAAAMAQAHAQSIELVLGSGLPPARLERELHTTLGSLLLLKDETTKQPFVLRVSTSLDYDVVDAPRGSLDTSMGAYPSEDCCVSPVPLYDTKTRLLIGLATFHANPFFVEHLIGELRAKLLWVVCIIIGLTALAWLESSRLLKRLGESEANLRQLFEAAPFPMVLHERGRASLRRANQAAMAYLDLREDIRGRISGEAWLKLKAAGLPADLAQGREVLLPTADGRERWALISAVPMRYSGASSQLVTLVDISELKAAQEELRTASRTDALTGLYNRRFIYERLAKEIELVRRYGHPLSIILFDLDHFKAINDAFGHRAGDEVLIQVGIVLGNCLRDVDVAGRYGGEEFLVILPHSTRAQALEAADRIRTALARHPWQIDGLRVTVSGGISEYAGEALDAFVDSADRKLYQVKASGRDKVLI